MSIVVTFDDDEIRQYNGSIKVECLSQAKERAEKMETFICLVVDCYNSDPN